ncbi:related to N-glycosyltransferase [Phialocephala subalpina]|uniref:Related to N-glycosyltransferase n=1 Tax=Phialocephala subalpina TaxID=576137 RepID=A0A1L7WJJ7_9HELO|nr:related to N-glycosyltransferase [Phialocephala subalpina]
MTSPKVKLLICITPVYGHVMPIRAVATALIGRGYDVTVLTGSDYKEKIEDIGATFVPLEGKADLTEAIMAKLIKNFVAVIPPPTGDALMLKTFIGWIPSQHESVQKALKSLKEADPEARILVLFESAFRGTLPTLLGAGDIRPIGQIGLGVVPIMGLTSIDTAPWKGGSRSDQSEEGRRENIILNEKDKERFVKSQARWEEILKETGSKDPELYWRDVPWHKANRFIQMCAPSIEYPRSDAPAGLRYSGGLGPGLRDPMKSFPSWWDDIALNPQKKRIIAVSQGTISTDVKELIIPTMMSMKDRGDVLVVAALGKRGAKLAEDFVVPDNTRYADFIPYDEMLQYADVFVTNGGYGSVQHALGNGVPLIVGGIGADKVDNAMRVAWSGAGINLETHRPTVEALQEAVMATLDDPKYKKRAKEIQDEMRSYDPIGVIEQSIEEVVRAST